VDQAETLRDLLARPAGPRRPLRVVAVTSGKGGVGKTNVSVNLAAYAAAQSQRVLLIDADLGLANSHIVLGVTPQYHLGHLLAGTVGLDEVLEPGPHGLRVLSAASGEQELTRLDDEQKRRLIAALDPLDDRFDLVLIDCGAGLGDNVVFFAAAAQTTLLVVTPEPTSLTDAYATVKVLSQRAGVRHFAVVVNLVADDRQARDVFQKLVRVTDRFLQASMRYAGSVPRDENVQRSVMAQQPIVTLYPQSPASRALGRMAQEVLSWSPPQPLDGGMKLMWQRMLRDQHPSVPLPGGGP
jgi:flagellar biosynthesis protein FlhG